MRIKAIRKSIEPVVPVERPPSAFGDGLVAEDATEARGFGVEVLPMPTCTHLGNPCLLPSDAVPDTSGKSARLPWEGQKAQWGISNLAEDKKLYRVTYRGMVLDKGSYISSPGFHVMGCEGFLRFWPNGYFNNARKRTLEREGNTDLAGLHVTSWCAVGLYMPQGTHLRLRFFVGSERSKVRDCYWDGDSACQQLWMPDSTEPGALNNLVVGVEVLRNLRPVQPTSRRPHGAARLPCGTPRAAHATPAALQRLSGYDENPAATAGAALRALSATAGTSIQRPSPRFACGAELRRLPEKLR